MNVLIVTAHPSKEGFTHKIAERFKDTSIAQGHKVKVLDLYDKKWKQDYLSFQNTKKDFPITDTTKRVQTEIDKATHLVFIHPVWWEGMPAIMKNFLDSNLTMGFAFTYSDKFPEGLLKGKTASVFVTADGPSIIYKLFGALKTQWKRWTLGFCGIKVKNYVLFDSMRKKRNEADRAKMLNKVERIAKKI
jgi:putative NADPH-quinone reductase